jgi:nucleoside-triphosphatase THEP1
MNEKVNLDKGTDLPEKFVFTDEFKKIFNKMENTQSNLFITGKAGCGKSTLLEYFRQNTKKNHIILSFTGLSALRARGMTIHSFFKFPPRFIQKKDKEIKIQRNGDLIRKLDTILIDECSTVRADLLDAIDESLRKNRKSKEIFGGVQIILIGDLLQISPIVHRSEKEVAEENYPKGCYFFNSRIFKKAKFETHQLSKIFRQSDESFINLLNKFRIAKVDDNDLSLINKRYQGEDFEIPEGVIKLATKNEKVDYINNAKLDQIKSKLFEYNAEIKGKFKSEPPVLDNLRLKVGAQVMIVKNDIDKRWVNGTVGFIHELDKDHVKIKIRETIHDLPKVKWENYEYTKMGEKIIPKVVGSFVQYPLKLAWAATIHKCQGQTFEKVAIDLDTGAFAHGQTYVALSRATSIEGIYLAREIERSDLVFDKKVFTFLGTELEKKYIDEIVKFKENTKSVRKLNNSDDLLDKQWTEKEDEKLINFYKKGIPEVALAGMFKVNIKIIRERILKILK